MRSRRPRFPIPTADQPVRGLVPTRSVANIVTTILLAEASRSLWRASGRSRARLVGDLSHPPKLGVRFPTPRGGAPPPTRAALATPQRAYSHGDGSYGGALVGPSVGALSWPARTAPP